MAQNLPAVRGCALDHWRLERTAGEEEDGYLLALLCAAGHVHVSLRTPLYAEALGLIRAWTCEVYGERHPGWRIEDRVRGVLILPSGREWPMAAR